MRATAAKPYMVQYCSAVNMKNANQKKFTARHSLLCQYPAKNKYVKPLTSHVSM